MHTYIHACMHACIIHTYTNMQYTHTHKDIRTHTKGIPNHGDKSRHKAAHQVQPAASSRGQTGQISKGAFCIEDRKSAHLQ
jgi:hypothetical protein